MAELKPKPTIAKKKQTTNKKPLKCLDCLARDISPAYAAIACQNCHRVICEACATKDDGLHIRTCASCDECLCSSCTEWTTCTWCFEGDVPDCNYCSECSGDALACCPTCEESAICNACRSALSDQVKVYQGECHNCIEDVIDKEKEEQEEEDSDNNASTPPLISVTEAEAVVSLSDQK